MPTDPDAHGATVNSRGAGGGDEVGFSTRPTEPSRSTEQIPSSEAGEPPAAPDPPAASGTPETPSPDTATTAPAPPPPPPPVDRVPRRRVGRVVAAIGTLLVVAFLAGAAFVPLPYFLFKPGSVRDTQPLIAVDGADIYASDGTISYTTVSLRQATLLGLVQGWLDDDIDVIDRDQVLQGRDPDENRQVNLQMMSDSKQVATQVALERLGYDVDTTVGQLVVEVLPDMPADGPLEPGDVITAIDGEAFDDGGDLSRLLADAVPGETIAATVRSPGGDGGREVKLTLAPSPDDPDKGVMGVSVREVVLDFEFPLDVEIDTGDVGGPSAGLAFTLAIIDELTPGELTGGTDVAVTGTMGSDGTVGQVGGTAQKAAAVREAGITLFLVPTADYDAAVSRAGDDLEVVAVDTIDEALAALGERGGNVDDLPPVGESAAAPTG